MSFFEPDDADTLADRMAQAWAQEDQDGRIALAAEAVAMTRYGVLTREFALRFLALAGS